MPVLSNHALPSTCKKKLADASLGGQSKPRGRASGRRVSAGGRASGRWVIRPGKGGRAGEGTRRECRRAGEWALGETAGGGRPVRLGSRTPPGRARRARGPGARGSP